MKFTEHIEDVKKKLAMQYGIVKIKALCTKKCFTSVLIIKYQTNHSIWCADILMCKLYFSSTHSSIAKKFSDSFCCRDTQKM